MKRPFLLLSVGSLALSACANPELTAALSADAPGFGAVAQIISVTDPATPVRWKGAGPVLEALLRPLLRR